MRHADSGVDHEDDEGNHAHDQRQLDQRIGDADGAGGFDGFHDASLIDNRCYRLTISRLGSAVNLPAHQVVTAAESTGTRPPDASSDCTVIAGAGWARR